MSPLSSHSMEQPVVLINDTTTLVPAPPLGGFTVPWAPSEYRGALRRSCIWSECSRRRNQRQADGHVAAASQEGHRAGRDAHVGEEFHFTGPERIMVFSLASHAAYSIACLMSASSSSG